MFENDVRRFIAVLELTKVLREIEDDARRYIAMLEPVEDLIDRRQRLQLDIGLDLAVDGEGERFGHVLACANERTSDRDAVRHHIEQRNREFAWRQPDQHASATLPSHTNALRECAERRSCDQNAMSSAAGLFLHRSCR